MFKLILLIIVVNFIMNFFWAMVTSKKIEKNADMTVNLIESIIDSKIKLHNNKFQK